MELFIFDIFPFLATGDSHSKSEFAVLSVARSDEFSPLKNAPGAGADCPETSRRDIFKQTVRFLEDAGAAVIAQGAGNESILNEHVPVLELSPLLTYDGESLADIVKGKKITIDKPTFVKSVDDLKALAK